MVVKLIPFYVILLTSVLTCAAVQAQNPFKTGSIPGSGGRPMSRSGGDSIKFEKRNFSDDSVNIRYRFLDTARFRAFDNSINDYFDKVALDPEDIHLGNNGTAARSLLFTPNMNPGWDPGFHGFDTYRFSINDTRFMTTTKPYTQLTYLLGSKAEQNIGIVHSQTIKPDWNFVFDYRLLNGTGFLISTNT